MLSLAFIGLGGAGGNVAEEAKRYGYHVGAINYSQRDLDSLEGIDPTFKLRILGTEGVGHNRDLAIELFTQHHALVIDFINKNFQTNDIIAIPFACGGGSGSGLAPIICDVLKSSYPDKTIIAMPILPDLSESTISQLNTLYVFEELSNLDVAVLPIDNQQQKAQFSSIGKDKLYTETNQKAVYLLHKLFSYTEQHSKNGNFDKRDFMTLFNNKGMTHITEINLSSEKSEGENVTHDSISKKINNSLCNGVFIPPQKEQIINGALIFEGNERLLSLINPESVFSYYDNDVIDLFEGNYSGKNNNLIIAASGLSWCKERLSKIEDMAEKKKEVIEKAFSNENQQTYQSRTSVSGFMSKIRQPKKKANSISDVLSKYKR
ncbi:hypothetical protein BEH_07335 [Priestia filamentosa]|uniref:Tubulin/FtsZ GTPase domain-containing protein n=1 Tax=Priestia filamentosa TaxID=1402861 RepID=A0A0H4KI10_9BACI|nr:hypothetical protein [Priestia filamentosa]AKO91929.1 hypothetical protein BEH_07335 [Priestia filamentosa]